MAKKHSFRLRFSPTNQTMEATLEHKGYEQYGDIWYLEVDRGGIFERNMGDVEIINK